MVINDVIKDLKEDLASAEKELGDAKILLEMGVDMGLDVSKRRAEIRSVEQLIGRYKRTLEKYEKKFSPEA